MPEPSPIGDTSTGTDHSPPEPAETTGRWAGPSESLEYAARSEWLVLREKEKPVAEIFSTSYLASGGDRTRPVTFVFNGGPGAASAFLHMGAVGPLRVRFAPDGTPPAPPAELVPNDESWLGFTDLVFVDPVGTGFSRPIEADVTAGEAAPSDRKDPKAFFGIERDLDSLGEFMSRWLSEQERWSSPIYIAGESYGGFRAGKLARRLPESFGIGLSGAILISPALEWAPLNPSDYDVLPWIDKLPTMAATAHFHGRSQAFDPDTDLDDVLTRAEEFATSDYVTFLTRGAGMDAAERDRILGRLADLLGLPIDLVVISEGRISMAVFVRELLRSERRVLGLYDATITAPDPFPDRPVFAGPDPTLAGIEATYTAAINRQLREHIGVETDRQYHLMSREVFEGWRIDVERHAFEHHVGATDDLRYGMAINPDLEVFITHGLYDLVTPYYSTERMRNLMRLDEGVAARLTVRHWGGGHMFYAWDRSRVAFTDAVADFYTRTRTASSG